MPLSLHAATVPSMLQVLGAGKGWLDKARASTLGEEEIVSARLAEDMLPFSYQVKSMAVHSMGAFDGIRKGVFSPQMGESPNTLAGLGEKLDEAIEYLSALTEEEVEGMRGNPMRFEIGEKRLPFDVDDFLLSFSQPNFYFHATTAYGVLRAKGVPLGKLDYLGALRIKRNA